MLNLVNHAACQQLNTCRTKTRMRTARDDEYCFTHDA